MNLEQFNESLLGLSREYDNWMQGNKKFPEFESEQGKQIKALRGLLYHAEFGSSEQLVDWIKEHQQVWRKIWANADPNQEISSNHKEEGQYFSGGKEQKKLLDWIMVEWLRQLKLRGDEMLIEGVRAWNAYGGGLDNNVWAYLMQQSSEELTGHPMYDISLILKNEPDLLMRCAFVEANASVWWQDAKAIEPLFKNWVDKHFNDWQLNKEKRKWASVSNLTHFQVLKTLWLKKDDLGLDVFKGQEEFFKVWIQFMENPTQLHTLAHDKMTDEQKEAWVQCWFLKMKHKPHVFSHTECPRAGFFKQSVLWDNPEAEIMGPWFDSGLNNEASLMEKVSEWVKPAEGVEPGKWALVIKGWFLNQGGWSSDVDTIEKYGLLQTSLQIRSSEEFMKRWGVQERYSSDSALGQVYELAGLMPDWDLQDKKIDKKRVAQWNKIHQELVQHLYAEPFYREQYLEGYFSYMVSFKHVWLDVLKEKFAQDNFEPLEFKRIVFSEPIHRVADLFVKEQFEIEEWVKDCVKIEQQYPASLSRVYAELGKSLIFSPVGKNKGFNGFSVRNFMIYWNFLTTDEFRSSQPMKIKHWLDGLSEEESVKEQGWIKCLKSEFKEIEKYCSETPERQEKWLNAILPMGEVTSIKRRL